HGRHTMKDPDSSRNDIWTRQFGRRRFLAGSATGAVGLFLAACSGGDGEGDATPTETATETATTSDAAYPRTVEHELGTVELPAYPGRIVSVTENEPLDCLVQLGVTPVLYGMSGGYIGRLPEWVQPYVD